MLWRKEGAHPGSSFPAREVDVRYGGGVIEGDVAYVIAWEFVTKIGQEEKFEAAYGPDGGWVELFRRDPRYIRTELVRDVANMRRYVTLDFWHSEQAYDEFREQHAEEYTLIDIGYESLAESEQLIGKFVTVDSTPARR